MKFKKGESDTWIKSIILEGMFCIYCGKENNDDSAFCFNCGKPIGNVISDLPVKNLHNNEKNSGSPNNNGKLVIALVAGAVLAIILFVILLVMVIGKNKSSDKVNVDEKVQQMDEVSIDNKEVEEETEKKENEEDISEIVDINMDDLLGEVEEEEEIIEDNNSHKSPRRIDVVIEGADTEYTLLYSNYEDYPDAINSRWKDDAGNTENVDMKVEYLTDDEGGLILGKWFGQFNNYIGEATQIYYFRTYMTPLITHYELDVTEYWPQAEGNRKNINDHITYDAQYDGNRLISEHYQNDVIDGFGGSAVVNTLELDDGDGDCDYYYTVTEGIINYTYENDRVIASVKLMSDRKEVYSIDYECGRLDDEGRIIHFVTYEQYYRGQRDGEDEGTDIKYVESLDEAKYDKNAKCDDYGQVTEYQTDETTYVYSYSEDGRMTERYTFSIGDYVNGESTYKYSYNENGDLVGIEDEDGRKLNIEYTEDGNVSQLTSYGINFLNGNPYELEYFKKYFADRKQASVFYNCNMMWRGSMQCSY